MECLEAEDREHTGHEVEQDAPGDGPKHRPQHGIPAEAAERRVTFGYGTPDGMEFEAAPAA